LSELGVSPNKEENEDEEELFRITDEHYDSPYGKRIPPINLFAKNQGIKV
jgi:hypothetical protein